MNGRFAIAVVAVSGIGGLAAAAFVDGVNSGEPFHLVGGMLMGVLFVAGVVVLSRVVVIGERERRGP